MTLPSLLSRVEAAAGPDRELERDVWEALTGECTHRNTHFVYLEDDERALECSDCGADTYGKDTWCGLSRSIDASVALCERVFEKPSFEMRWGSCNASGEMFQPFVRLEKCIGEREFGWTWRHLADGRAATPALALLAAILRARIAEGAE